MKSINDNGTSPESTFDEKTCERYLFGELSDGEQEVFEAAYFADDQYFDRFLAVKNEILDTYARGAMDRETRRRFERHFNATPPRRRRIDESRAFVRDITSISERAGSHKALPQNPARSSGPSDPGWLGSLNRFFTMPRFAVAALLLAASAGVWLFYRSTSNGVTGSEIAVSHTPIAVESSKPAESAIDTTSIPEAENRIGSELPNMSGTAPALDSAIPTDSLVTEPRERSTTTRAQRNGELNPNSSQDLRKYVRRPPYTDKRADTEVGSTLSTVGRDKGRVVGPAQTSGRIVEGERLPSVILEPIASRASNNANTVKLTEDTQNITIGLRFTGSRYSSHSVTVTTVNGIIVWRGKPGVSKSVNIAEFVMPTSIISGKDYIVTLQGLNSGQPEIIHEYYFNVERISKSADPTPTPQP